MSILILDDDVTNVIAASTLYEHEFDNFRIATLKHNIKMQFNDLFGSLCKSTREFIMLQAHSQVRTASYDFNDLANFTNTSNKQDDAFMNFTVKAGQ